MFTMDETACYMGMPSSTTIDVWGAKSVSLKTTGHENDNFTVIFSACVDGKLKPIIIFKGKGTRLIKDLSKITGVVVKFSEDEWKNDGLTAVHLHSILGSLSFSNRLLVWDSYKCHTLTLQTAVVPGSCTKFIQTPDVVWNFCFKSDLRWSYVHSLLCMNTQMVERWNRCPALCFDVGVRFQNRPSRNHSAPVLLQPVQMEVMVSVSTASRLASCVKLGGVSC